MRLKPFILFFLVLFPVCIYLFLQTFGENKFSIPDLGTIVDLEEAILCKEQNDQPGKIDFSKSDFVLLKVLNKPISEIDQYKIDINRINERFDYAYPIVSAHTDLLSDSILYDNHASQNMSIKEPFLDCLKPLKIYLESEELNENLIHNNWFILFNNQKKIKGFYQVEAPEDIDRLIIELTLLSEKS